jgi:hypothetical protein
MGMVIACVAVAAPAEARTRRAAAIWQVEDHFRISGSQWTDCPAPPVSTTVVCIGVSVQSLWQRSRIGTMPFHEQNVSVDLVHVRISPDRVTIGESFAHGSTSTPFWVNGHPSAVATVPLSDGTNAVLDITYAPDGTPVVDSGTAEVGRPCPTGIAHVQFTTTDVNAIATGSVQVHGHATVETSFVQAPFLHTQDDVGTCG